MNIKRYPAFTIFEVVITMVITAIVVAIAYTSYSILQRSYQQYHQKHQQMAQLLRLDELLKKDIERCSSIKAVADSLLVANSGRTVSYQFKPAYVLRRGGITDTFKFSFRPVEMRFENKPVTIETAEDRKIVDEIYFQAINSEYQMPYYYFKRYSSADLFNLNNDADH